jgi:hypothetical protein
MSEKEVRLIDANALLKKKREMELCFAVPAWEIENAPTIDPGSLRPHGKWRTSETDWFELHIIQCSVCGEEWCFEELGDVAAMNYHYCPNCGAKMEE